MLLSDERIKGKNYTKFPGGGLEFGEGTIECVIREFKEETSLDVTVIEHFYTTDFFQLSYFQQQQIISIYYLLHCKDYSNLKTITEPFDYSGLQLNNDLQFAEVLRWKSLLELSVNDVHLPIDKKVVEILLQKNL